MTYFKQVNRVFKKPDVEDLKEIFGTDSEDEKIPKKKAKKVSKRKKRAPSPPSEEEVVYEEVEEGGEVSDSDYSN